MELSPQVAGLISIFIGLCCGVYLAWLLARLQASKNWPTTKAEILQSRVEQDSDGWIPYVSYRYTVDQQDFEGARIGVYTANTSTESSAKRQLINYPSGKTVRVFYNPRNPKEAVLDIKMSLWLKVFWLALTAFFLVAGVQMWRGEVF